MVKKITKYHILMLYTGDYNKRYYLGELASLLKKPHQTIKPYVEALTKEKILIKIKRKNITEFFLNLKDKKTYSYLIIAENERTLERIQQDTIIRLLFEKLSKHFQKNTFILFGSAVNSLQKGSDIDLLVIGKQNIVKTLEEFESVYNKKIHKIQIIKLESLTPALLKEIYKKHLILNNMELVIRFFGDLYEKNKLV